MQRPYGSMAAMLLVASMHTLADDGARAQQDAALALLGLLNDGQRSATALPWDHEARREWTYLPWGHSGLPLSEMNAAQAAAATALLHSGLSDVGRERARQVMELEADEAENGLLSRLWTDGEAYYTTVFGAPGADRPWSWRFEGHHLSVNYTHSGGEIVAGTPYFIGADPAVVREGPLTGMRILEREEVDARALYLSLDSEQQRRALIDEKAPRDILTGRDSRALLPCCEGIRYTELNESQRAALVDLVERIANHLQRDSAELHLWRMRRKGMAHLTFAWAGSSRPGEGHYYRIQGPTLLIEYDNTQNNANHIHLVLRDPDLDFGGDPLLSHYHEHHHGALQH